MTGLDGTAPARNFGTLLSSHLAMNPLPRLARTLAAIVLIAACALPVSTAAQSSSKNVVQTERVRAELMAHAPAGRVHSSWVGRPESPEFFQ